MFWYKSWEENIFDIFVFAGANAGGWGNLLVSVEKHACFQCINKDCRSYWGLATYVELIWWPSTSFLHTDAPSPSQDRNPGWGWTRATGDTQCQLLVSVPMCTQTHVHTRTRTHTCTYTLLFTWRVPPPMSNSQWFHHHAPQSPEFSPSLSPQPIAAMSLISGVMQFFYCGHF